MALELGARAPAFTLRSQHREKVSLEDLMGSRSVIVFMPFAFTSTCHGEMCEIRDNLHRFRDNDVRVVVITCNTLHANRVWAEQEGFDFEILSDFWPHGEVTRAYDTFSELYGAAIRTTYFLDEDGVVTSVIGTDELGTARPFDEYESVLTRSRGS
jgi:mycoredoxin-dependent peroxiredoxin